MHDGTCIIPPSLHFVLDCHNLAYHRHYVVIGMNNINFVFGLVMPAVSSKVVWFSAHIASSFWSFSARVLELVLCSFLGPIWFFMPACFLFPFAITLLTLEYPVYSYFSLSFISSLIRRCFWSISNKKSSELCSNIFLYPFHKCGNFAMIAPVRPQLWP